MDIIETDSRLLRQYKGVTRFTLRTHITSSGNSPFNKWFSKLDGTQKNQVRTRLDRVQNGQMGHSKSVRQNMEAILFNSGMRIYFTRESPNVIILLCGGNKASQDRDINQALKFIGERYAK